MRIILFISISFFIGCSTAPEATELLEEAKCPGYVCCSMAANLFVDETPQDQKLLWLKGESCPTRIPIGILHYTQTSIPQSLEAAFTPTQDDPQPEGRSSYSIEFQQGSNCTNDWTPKLENYALAQISDAVEKGKSSYHFSTELSSNQIPLPCEGNVSKKGISLLIFGDSGKLGDQQTAVANSMLSYCASHSCDAALVMGDQVYDSGIGLKEFDKAKTHFVDPFSPLKIPAYLVLGNHDLGLWRTPLERADDLFHPAPYNDQQFTNLYVGKRSGALGYTYHDETNYYVDSNNARRTFWNLPEENYRKRFSGISQNGDALVADFIGLNTNPAFLYSDGDSMFNHNTLYEGIISASSEQYPDAMQYLKDAIGKSKNSLSPSDWIIAGGHHPLMTHGHHGTGKDGEWMGKLVGGLGKELCDKRVDLYLSGHDHLQEINAYKCENGHILFNILTGAASKTEEERRELLRNEPPGLQGNGQYDPQFPSNGGKSLIWINGVFWDNQTKLSGHEYTKPWGFGHLDIVSKDTLNITMLTENRADSCFQLSKKGSVKFKKIDCSSI